MPQNFYRPVPSAPPVPITSFSWWSPASAGLLSVSTPLHSAESTAPHCRQSLAPCATIRQGLAIGPLAPDRAEGLVEAMSLPEWDSTLWIVSHVDLHRTPKVQAALTVLRRPA